MILVRSYVEMTDKSLVPVEDAQPPLPDDFYTEGLLLLEIDGVAILDEEMKDDVKSLWHYLAAAVKELLESGHGATTLPDQPVDISLERAGREGVRIAVTNIPDPVAAETNLVELVTALSAGAQTFFRAMGRLRPDRAPSYSEARAQWKALAARASEVAA